jgi:hypothetical protein
MRVALGCLATANGRNCAALTTCRSLKKKYLPQCWTQHEMRQSACGLGEVWDSYRLWMHRCAETRLIEQRMLLILGSHVAS